MKRAILIILYALLLIVNGFYLPTILITLAVLLGCLLYTQDTINDFYKEFKDNVKESVAKEEEAKTINKTLYENQKNLLKELNIVKLEIGKFKKTFSSRK